MREIPQYGRNAKYCNLLDALSRYKKCHHKEKYDIYYKGEKMKKNRFTPREPERIERILAVIKEIWQRFPDLRLGQLLNNAVPELETNLFYTEDTITEEKLTEFKNRINE